MTTTRTKSRLQFLLGDGKAELKRASSKTLLYLGHNSNAVGSEDRVLTDSMSGTTTARPRALSKKLSRLQILLGTEQDDAARLSAKSKRYMLKDSLNTSQSSSVSGSTTTSKVTPLLTVSVQDERITDIATPPAGSRDSTASERETSSVCMRSGRNNLLIRLLVALGLLSSCAQGAYTAGVSLTFSVPPLGVLGPITGQVTGLPGGPGLYKGIVVFNGQCNIWW